MGSLNRSTWKALAAATLLCATPALAACGSDSDDSGGGGSADAGGDPITIMVYGPFDAKGFSIPGIKTGAEAGVAKVNDEGGIDGRKIELVTCNDNNDPNTAAGCARRAVEEGVVAATGLSVMESSIVPNLQKAGIPVVANLPITDFTTDNQYPLIGGGAGTQFGISRFLAQSPECGDGIAIVQEEFAATSAVLPLIELAVQASGNKVVGVGKAAQGAADFGPAIQAAADKSNCVIELIGPTVAAGVVQQVNANPAITLAGSSDSQVPGAVVAALGAAADGLLVTNEYLPLDDSTKDDAMVEFLKRGRQIDEKFDPEGAAASAYLAPQVIKAALEGAGTTDVTAESLVEALDGLSDFDTGLGPVVDFTKKNPTKAFARLPAVGKLYVWVAKDGQYVLENPEPVDVTSIYEAAAAAGQ